MRLLRSTGNYFRDWSSQGFVLCLRISVFELFEELLMVASVEA